MSCSLADIIPEDWTLWSKTKPQCLKPLLGGLTNKSYLISASDGDMVLRLNSAISEALNLDRATEAEVLALAHRAELCAPLVHYDANHQYVVSHFVAGQHWQANEAGLVSLAALLRRIHALPPVASHLDVHKKVANYWRAIDSKAEFTPELRALAEQVNSHIERATALSDGVYLCHNDLLLENLIVADDGQLYAIDWEYAAMGDAFYELAVVIDGHGLNESQQQLLMTEYLARPVTDTDWQRLRHWRVIYRYLTVLWYAVQWSSGRMANAETAHDIVEQIHNIEAW